jgi:hypothetical protein
MSYYRNGVKRGGEWTYSVQACKEEFLTNYLDQNFWKSPSQLTFFEL